MLKTNYHTHTDFCDGKGSPEEIAQAAIEKGFDILGFSSHSMYPFAGSWHIQPEDFNAYINAVNSAKEKFSGKLKILLGFEADYVPPVTKPDFERYKKLSPDFIIGSVHYVFSEKGRLCVDYSPNLLKEKIDGLYGGDSRKLVCEYFRLERQMLSECSFSIIGHADLIRKNNDVLKMFSENDSWYRKEIKETADAIKKSGVIAEINTGAISRGYMKGVYPSDEFLALLHERNVPVTISSDSHAKENLDCAFGTALSAATKAGYTELAFIDDDKKIKFQKI